MRTHVLLVALLLIGGMNLNAQSFNPGSIVSIEGEITHGFIRNAGPIKRCAVVEFKVTEAGEVKKYYPGDLSAYQIQELQYQSIDVVLSGEDLARKVFARKLVVGEPSLYRLDYEVRENTGPIFDYRTTFYIAKLSAENKAYILSEGNYMGVLEYWLGACDIVKQQNAIARYNHQDDDLSMLIADYNACRGETATILTTKLPVKGEFQVGGSLSYMVPSITPAHNRYAYLERGKSMGFAAQLSATGYFWDYLGLRMGAGYSKRTQNWKKSHLVEDPYINAGTEYVINGKSELNNVTMSLEAMLRLCPERTIQPYLFGGFVFGFGIKSDNYVQEVTFESTADGIVQVIHEFYPYKQLNDPGNDIGTRFGAGLNWQLSANHLLQLEVFNHRSRNDLLKTSSLAIETNSWGVSLGFLFR